jgi:transketolase C-terminal domain/subunit
VQFVAQLLQQGNTVVATGRDPSSSPGLQQLAEKHGDKLITMSMEASDPSSVVQWAAALKEGGRIPHVDVSCCKLVL